MKTSSENRRRRAACLAVGAMAGAAGVIAALPAEAALGGSMSSVEQDRAHMSASLLTTTSATHSVHSLTLANGDLVREFMNPDGSVFAVAWKGPSRPDLRQLLGDRFAVLQADNTGGVHRGGHGRVPMTVNRSDFVLRAGGHSGAFWGLAYLPGQTPAAFSAKELRMEDAQ